MSAVAPDGELHFGSMSITPFLPYCHGEALILKSFVFDMCFRVPLVNSIGFHICFSFLTGTTMDDESISGRRIKKREGNRTILSSKGKHCRKGKRLQWRGVV